MTAALRFELTTFECVCGTTSCRPLEATVTVTADAVRDLVRRRG